MINLQKILVFFLFLAFLAPKADAAEYTVNKIAAVVNGEMISLHTLNTKIDEECKRRGVPKGSAQRNEITQQVLDAMINDILLRQDAKKYKISVTYAEVDTEIRNRMQAQRMTMPEFEKYLADQGTNMEEYKESIRSGALRNRMINLMISRKVVVTKEEIKEYYDAHPEQFASQKAVEFAPIIFAEGANAKAIYDQLKAGKISFDDAVRKYSQVPNRDAGAQPARAPWNALPDEMQRALSSVSVGEVTPPVSVQGKTIIFKLFNIGQMPAVTLEQASEKITENLKEPRLQARFNEYMSQLREKAVIDVRL